MKKRMLLSLTFLGMGIISYAQNVGIGTTTPEGVLHLKSSSWIKTIFENAAGQPKSYIGTDPSGTITIGSNAYWNGSSWVYPTAGTGSLYLLLHQPNQAFEFRVRPDAGTQSTPMVIKMNGNVGIGTTSPQQNLSVGAGVVVDQNNNNTGTSDNILRFGNNSGEGIGSKRNTGTGQWGLDFYTGNINRMHITNNGNVGIGTTNTPNEKLQVAGAVNLGNTTATNAGTIRFNTDNNDFEGYDGTQWRSLTANGNFMAPQSDTGYNQQAGDKLGYVVRMVDDYLFVGAPNADIGANANQGAVYIYRKNNFSGKYEMQQTITAPDGALGDQFGTSLDGKYVANSNVFKTYYLAVGAPKKTVAGHANQGSVYLFVQDIVTGLFRITIGGIATASDGATGDQLGNTVIISPLINLTGSRYELSILANAPGKTVNGNIGQGRVYVAIAPTTFPAFEYFENLSIGNSIDSPEPSVLAAFGYSMAFCPCNYLNKPLANGPIANDEINCDGYAYYLIIGSPGFNSNRGKVFTYVVRDYYQEDTSFVPDDVATNDNFGVSIEIADKRVYVGASGKQVGANATQGQVYVLKDTAQSSKRNFVKTGIVTAPNGQANDRFGYALKAENNFLMVSSHQNDDIATDAGATYIYEKNIGMYNFTHSFRRKITDPAGRAQDNLGLSIDLLNSKFVIGVPNWDNNGKTNSGKIIFGSLY